MRLTVLGNNGPFPAPGGACSGYLLTWGQGAVQLDLGCGTLPRLTGLLPPEKLDALVLSHWHGDHCSDLLPLLYRMEAQVAQGGEPLNVYAPVDAQSPVRQAVMASRGAVLHDVAPGDEVTIAGATFAFAAARHPVPAVMVRVAQGGSVLCYTGDTNTCDALPDFVRDADLLLADGLFTRDSWGENKPHLSAALCAEMAVRAGVKQLMITHLHPAIAPAALLEEARAVFPGAVLSHVGDTVVLAEH